VLALALLGCGGASQPAPARVAPPVAAKPEPVVETADLSPVVRPPSVFVTGRLKRPTALADTVAHWAGVPLGLRDVLPFAAKDLDSVLVWDAPVEFSAALAPSGARGVVEAAFSLGLTGTEQALRIARHQGYEVKRLGPEIYAVGGTGRLSCAVAPSLGSAAARLVCAHRPTELDDLLPYMTRGLPNEALGQRDLEVELKIEPLRRQFASQIGSARLFAGFLVREMQLDAPRFDTALSDAAYAAADELVAVVHDLDTVRLAASVDDQKHVIDAELTLAMGDKKSWSAAVLSDRAAHVGPAPAEFFTLPADASSASYARSHDPRLLEHVSSGLVELADAYLEQKKIGKATRERVGRILQTYFAWDGELVSADGQGTLLPKAKGARSESPRDWMLLRIAHPPAKLRALFADFAAILADRELRAVVARALHADEKELPQARMVPLRGDRIPPGTQALLLKAPTELRSLVGRSLGLGSKALSEGPDSERAIAVIPNGPEAFVASAETPAELAARLGQALSGKASSLAVREELSPLRSYSANWAGFSSLLSIVTGALGSRVTAPGELGASLPNHGKVPVFFQWTAEPGPGPKATFRTSIPAGVFEDLPGLVPSLAASLLDRPGSRP